MITGMSASVRVGLERREHRPAVHARHHHVERDRVGPQLARPAQALLAARRPSRPGSPPWSRKRCIRSRTAGSSSITSTVPALAGVGPRSARPARRAASGRARRTIGRQADGEGASPAPGSLSTVMSPPIIWQNCRLIARPRPVPPYLRVVEASAWVKASKQLARSARASCRCRCRCTRNIDPVAVRRPARGAPSSVIVPSLGELAGVAQQVEQHLPHLGQVGAHRAERRRRTATSSVLPFFSTSGWMVAATSCDHGSATSKVSR